ncbi:MAG: hypothetical protein LUG19_03620, partial [Desulfovibrio sp.]|nr:hypothetical protein [Desulfovibrio sp.]
MNKVILSLLLAVCILGMALIMLNERLGRKSEPAPAPSAEVSQPTAPDNGAGLPPPRGGTGRHRIAAAPAPGPGATPQPPVGPPAAPTTTAG